MLARPAETVRKLLRGRNERGSDGGLQLGGSGVVLGASAPTPSISASRPFLLFAVLTVVDFIVPDVIPLADEIGLALLTVLFGMWKERRILRSNAGGRGTR